MSHVVTRARGAGSCIGVKPSRVLLSAYAILSACVVFFDPQCGMICMLMWHVYTVCMMSTDSMLPGMSERRVVTCHICVCIPLRVALANTHGEKDTVIRVVALVCYPTSPPWNQ